MTTQLKIIAIAFLLIVMLSGGGLQKSHAQTVDATIITAPVADNAMDCHRYEVNLYEMFDLQSKRLYARGWLKKYYENKINKLWSGLIETEVQCLGYGVTPN